MADSKNFGLTRTPDGPTVPHALAQYAFREDEGFRFVRMDDSEVFYSFKDLDREMRSRAHHLNKLGLKKGDRVAFIVPEPEDFVLTFLGAMAAGIVPVPMYPPLSFGKLDAYIEASGRIIEASKARVLLTDGRVQNILWSLVDAVPCLERIETVDTFRQPASSLPELIDLTHNDVAFLQFTSGSTSHPKGVVVTHGSLLANLDGIMNVGLKIDDTDRAVSWLPLYHDMGLIGFMLAPAWYGVPTTYLPPTTFVKHPGRWMETMSRDKATISFAPNFAYALATRRTKPEKVAQLQLGQVKVLGCGAEPNHPDTLQSFVEHFAPAGLKPQALLPCYGMAEATLAMTFVGLDEPLKVDRVDAETYQAQKIAQPASQDSTVLEFVSCGKPFPGHDVLVVNDQMEILPERHVGEIVFRGPSVTPGYFEAPEKTAESFKEFGLFTGDLGYFSDGELYVTGRKKDVIILNGRNYDPQSIEWVVQDIDGIRKGNVVAFSVPSSRSEELVVVAEIRPGSDQEFLKKEITRIVRDALGLAPAEIALVGAGQLPKTSSGKLQRAKTREQFLNHELGKEGERTHGARATNVTLAKHVAKSTVSRVKHGVLAKVRSTLSRDE